MKTDASATWRFQVISFAVWIFFCLKVVYESLAIMNKTAEDKFFYEVYIYYNPVFLMTTMVWLWGINVWMFLNFNVPYAQVFELGSNYINHKDIWKIASWMTAATITSMTSYLHLYSHNMISYAVLQPVLLYLMVPLVLGLPLDIFYIQTRTFFLKTLVRLAFPIQPMAFCRLLYTGAY